MEYHVTPLDNNPGCATQHVGQGTDSVVKQSLLATWLQTHRKFTHC